MDTESIDLVLALAADTMSLQHHESVDRALDMLVDLFPLQWSRMRCFQRSKLLRIFLRQNCTCVCCTSLVVAEIEADFPKLVANRRRILHHKMLAELFYCDLRVHVTHQDIERLFQNFDDSTVCGTKNAPQHLPRPTSSSKAGCVML